MMERFANMRALVVGGGNMGAAICRDLAAEGAHVFFTYNTNRAGAEELAASLGDASAFASLDITDTAGVARVVASASEAMGGIDILVITTGHVSDMTLLVDQEFAAVRRTIEIELIGLIDVARRVVPVMIDGEFGRIVFVGSDSGKVGSTGEAASSAARGGVIAFGKALARETARYDICVNTVCPGPTEGPLLDSLLDDDGLTGKLAAGMMRAVPKRRAARTGEIANAVLFLASADSGMITGQALSVSGGLTMS